MSQSAYHDAQSGSSPSTMRYTTWCVSPASCRSAATRAAGSSIPSSLLLPDECYGLGREAPRSASPLREVSSAESRGSEARAEAALGAFELRHRDKPQG